jgi:hypothetical protein
MDTRTRTTYTAELVACACAEYRVTHDHFLCDCKLFTELDASIISVLECAFCRVGHHFAGANAYRHGHFAHSVLI